MNMNLLDIAKLNGNDAVIGLIEENLKYAPEMSVIPARTIRGTSYKTVRRVGLPTVGFRSANQGVTPSRSTFADELVQCYIVDSQIEVDKAVADAHEDGADAVKALEASGVMQAALQEIGQQIFYGVSNDAKGFPGLKAFSGFGATTTVTGDPMTINATGTTATTASSVYAVAFGPQAVQLVFGNNVAIELGEWTTQQLTDADGKKYTGYCAGMGSWAGLQIVNQNAVKRICNLTEETGKGLSDALLAKLTAAFPVGLIPSAIFMSRRSRRQLQASRTVTLFGQGTGRPNQPLIAPTPTEFEGIPIIVTDSIGDTDAIES